MKARDIMTRDVVTVSPDTPVREIAALMAERHISGVPVLAHDGTIIGMISETDLLHRAELGTEPEERKRWLDFNALAREYAKAYGLRAQVVMSRCVVAVRGDAGLRDVADVHRAAQRAHDRAAGCPGPVAQGTKPRQWPRTRLQWLWTGMLSFASLRLNIGYRTLCRGRR